MQSIITISNLNLKISQNPILKNINTEIPKNKITVLLGPSGCGKTTLLKTINRLTDLYDSVEISGEIIVNGISVFSNNTDLIKLRQKTGLLSQRPYPLPMSIGGNITYALKLSGLKTKSEITDKTEYFLKKVHLWEEVHNRLNQPAAALSIGQQQRLCFARGLAVNPDIILADEPTSALDPASSQAIEQLFIELKESYTIIVVTHILRQAKRLADNVIFMYLGEIIEQGNNHDFFNNPVMQQTKNYLNGTFN